MNFNLPDNIADLSASDIRKVAADLRAARKQFAVDNMQMSADQFAEWTQAGQTISILDDLADEAERVEKADAAEKAAAEKAAADQVAAEKVAAETVEVVEEDEPVVEEVAAASVAIPTGLSLDSDKQVVKAGSGWIATGLGGVSRGTEFASLTDLGEVVQDIMASMAAGDNDKRIVATLPARTSDAQRISGDQWFVDLAARTTQDEIQAAFCPPLTPLYDLSCANDTSRPVFNGLPTFVPEANRGGFRVPESPSLFDITGGFGQWTSTNDADLEAIKDACQTISCVSWNDFEWYATYRCLTVRNMMQMTFPELVEAYLNRLQARWARYAETLLLEAMGTASTSVDGFAQAYGANVSLTRTIMTYIAKYAEIERWDTPAMDAWMPRWLLWALRMDLASRRQDAYVPATQAEVERRFSEIGVTCRWYMDRPSWATPISPLAVNGDLTMFPSQVEILIHRRGKFAVMDKGELNLGLGGNPFRMEDDVRRNQATFFFESFEGLIDTDSCPAHIITVPGLCYNGRQIADAQIECEGYDMVGVGSGA